MQTKRIVVFLLGCILTRFILMILAKKLDPKYVRIMGYLAIPIGLSFLYLYLIGNKRADAQLEWLGDKKIWWNDLRPIHGMLYLLFAVYAIKGRDFAWVVLLVDVLLGLSAWLIHHRLLF